MTLVGAAMITPMNGGPSQGNETRRGDGVIRSQRCSTKALARVSSGRVPSAVFDNSITIA